DQASLLADELMHFQVATGVGVATDAIASDRLDVLADESLAVGVRELVAPLAIDLDHPRENRLLRVGILVLEELVEPKAVLIGDQAVVAVLQGGAVHLLGPGRLKSVEVLHRLRHLTRAAIA